MFPITPTAAGNAPSDREKAALREALNTRVMQAFEAAWPALYRELGRIARARWEVAPLNERPRRRWKITTTTRLLEAPAPSTLESTLGIAAACIHVDLLCHVRGAFEGWTITFRAFAEHDEVQVIGANIHVSTVVSLAALRNLLRAAVKEGPGYYSLTLLRGRHSALHEHPPVSQEHEHPGVDDVREDA